MLSQAQTLVLTVVQLNGQQLSIVVANLVVKVVLHVRMVVLALNVKLDTKVMDMGDVIFAMLEHTHLLVDLVFLALQANGHLLEVMLAQTVLRLVDVMAVRQPRPVPPVLLDMKVITVEDAIPAVLAISLNSMVTPASPVLAANTQMQHQALVRFVMVMVLVAALALR